MKMFKNIKYNNNNNYHYIKCYIINPFKVKVYYSMLLNYD